MMTMAGARAALPTAVLASGTASTVNPEFSRMRLIASRSAHLSFSRIACMARLGDGFGRGRDLGRGLDEQLSGERLDDPGLGSERFGAVDVGQLRIARHDDERR